LPRRTRFPPSAATDLIHEANAMLHEGHEEHEALKSEGESRKANNPSRPSRMPYLIFHILAFSSPSCFFVDIFLRSGEKRMQNQWICLRATALFLGMSCAPIAAHADDWPQWLGPQRDGVWRETGILRKFPAGGPKVRWRTPVGEGYSGPSVAKGKVYITDRVG